MSVYSGTASSANRHCWLPTLELAVQEVFELMVATRLDLSVQPSEEEGLDVTSMVGLAGQLCGVLSLRCGSPTAALLASRMLGLEAEKVQTELYDALGEICNMIAGNFKNKIAGLGDGCMLSVPTVISGGDYNLHSLVNDEMRSVFQFEGQPIVVTLEIHN